MINVAWRLFVCAWTLRRTDEVMLAKFSSVWTLFSLAAFIVVSQCLAAPTSQRQDDGGKDTAAAAANADPALVRSTYSHTHTHKHTPITWRMAVALAAGVVISALAKLIYVGPG